MSLAVYPGSFDPITFGHIDVIARAVKIFDRLIVAVAHNLEKNPVFSVGEREGMIKETLKNIPRVEIDSFEGLLVDMPGLRVRRL